VSAELRSVPTLGIERVTKRYGTHAALNNVSLHINPGEVVALLGDNGAGKSTLVKWLAGVHVADSGRLLVDGVEVRLRDPQHARSLGIGVVYQDLALFDNLSVAENLFTGNELVRPRRLRGLGFMQSRLMARRSAEILDRLEVRVPNQRIPIGLLSGGQRQAIAVAKAVAFAERIIILDEPTAALGVRETANVLRLVERLAGGGTSVLLISHNMENVMRVAHRAVVLRQGLKVGEVDPSPENHERMVSMIVGGKTPA
jgi:D-xylose transport system ATP-binding protein